MVADRIYLKWDTSDGIQEASVDFCKPQSINSNTSISNIWNQMGKLKLNKLETHTEHLINT